MIARHIYFWIEFLATLLSIGWIVSIAYDIERNLPFWESWTSFSLFLCIAIYSINGWYDRRE